LVLVVTGLAAEAATVEIPAETLRDKIRGGLLGQLLGNLNGLPYEMKYITEPGTISGYVPALAEGAWTDDDTDFEWVYVVEMQRANALLLPPEAIARLWRERINQRIWCSNQYARQLMDLGLEPPLTGNVLLNPWAEFNISGQFLCETFGLIAPAMPQTASRIGLHYTRVAIDGEPAQTTQLFDAMIATAFRTEDLQLILNAGTAAVDPDSTIRRIVEDVRRWHRASPDDWKTARLNIQDKYSRHRGEMRDRNGYELNTASTIAALLYGNSDFARTLELAFNFGWDCDNNAATAGTVLGVTHGYRRMLAQGWRIVDRYRNETRDHMPTNETITSFADRLIDLAELVIEEQGGRRLRRNGQVWFAIEAEDPRNVAPLPGREELLTRTRNQLRDRIATDLASGEIRARARGAYLAICLELTETFRDQSGEQWRSGLEALRQFDQVGQVLFHHSPVPAATPLQQKAIEAGLERPLEKRALW
jgi:ADP-ribosylglycohydrolase